MWLMKLKMKTEYNSWKIIFFAFVPLENKDRKMKKYKMGGGGWGRIYQRFRWFFFKYTLCLRSNWHRTLNRGCGFFPGGVPDRVVRFRLSKWGNLKILAPKSADFAQNSDLVRVLVQITLKIRTFSFDWRLWFFAKMLLFFYVSNQIFFFTFLFLVKKTWRILSGKKSARCGFFPHAFFDFWISFREFFFVCAYFRSMRACDFVFKFLLFMKKMYTFFFLFSPNVWNKITGAHRTNFGPNVLLVIFCSLFVLLLHVALTFHVSFSFVPHTLVRARWLFQCWILILEMF